MVTPHAADTEVILERERRDVRPDQEENRQAGDFTTNRTPRRDRLGRIDGVHRLAVNLSSQW